jgi:phospholipid-transporting ATPase
MVMVLPNFWLGIYSMYSGSFFYEKFIYQLYNIVFTSLPIIWYSLFDYSHKREEYTKNPNLYQIGLRKECFNNRVFWFWISYGAFQALLILYFCFYQMELDQPDYWASGQIALGAVVMVVNLTIIAQMNIFDIMGVTLPLLSILVYFFVYWFFNTRAYNSDALYGTFS